MSTEPKLYAVHLDQALVRAMEHPFVAGAKQSQSASGQPITFEHVNATMSGYQFEAV